MFPTPDLSHLSSKDYCCVYEPAEDTFLLLDALEKEVDFLKGLRPSVGLEIGSGSGCIITFLSRLLHPHPVACMATDVNPAATHATRKTAERNLASVDVVLTSLSQGLSHSRRIFDVILFNPPYVPTEGICEAAMRPSIENIHGSDPERLLEAAWAGGECGRYWIDLLLPKIDGLMSDDGVFYMIALSANKPSELMQMATDRWQFGSKIVLERRAGIEMLHVLKFWRQ